VPQIVILLVVEPKRIRKFGCAPKSSSVSAAPEASGISRSDRILEAAKLNFQRPSGLALDLTCGLLIRRSLVRAQVGEPKSSEESSSWPKPVLFESGGRISDASDIPQCRKASVHCAHKPCHEGNRGRTRLRTRIGERRTNATVCRCGDPILGARRDTVTPFELGHGHARLRHGSAVDLDQDVSGAGTDP
jgi:hypothetical protein